MNLEQLAANDPSAPPHWRLGLAREIAAGKIRKPGATSPALSTAVRYLKSGSRGAQEFPRVAAALDLHEQNGQRRWAVEAWLLAGLADREISNRTGIPATVVRLFEQLCFPVREFALAVDWIGGQILRWKHIAGFRNADVRELWLGAGWRGGPLLVDLLVDCLPAGNSPTLLSYLSSPAVPVELKGYIACSVDLPGPLGRAWAEELGIQHLEARRARDPEAAREKVRMNVIRIAKYGLAGVPYPAPPERSEEEKGASRRLLARSLMNDLLQVLPQRSAVQDDHNREPHADPGGNHERASVASTSG